MPIEEKEIGAGSFTTTSGVTEPGPLNEVAASPGLPGGAFALAHAAIVEISSGLVKGLPEPVRLQGWQKAEASLFLCHVANDIRVAPNLVIGFEWHGCYSGGIVATLAVSLQDRENIPVESWSGAGKFGLYGRLARDLV